MNFEGFVLATFFNINIIRPSKFAQYCKIYVVEQNINLQIMFTTDLILVINLKKTKENAMANSPFGFAYKLT